MTLLKIILLIVVLLIVLVNGEYLQYNETCPNPTLPDDLDLEELDANLYYVVAETVNETLRSNVIITFESINDHELKMVEVFRSESGDCVMIKFSLKEVGSGKYVVLSHNYTLYKGNLQVDTGELDTSNFQASYLFFLSENVIFLCRNTVDRNQFYAEVRVIDNQLNEVDSEEREYVQDILEMYSLNYMNGYLFPIKHDNPCFVD